MEVVSKSSEKLSDETGTSGEDEKTSLPTTPLVRTPSMKSLNFEQTQKIEAIRKVCEARDLKGLVELALSADGLVNDDARREACMLR